MVPVASFTVTKLRWLAHHEPESAERTARVCLPHDWLTWCLAGQPDVVTTDRSDASGTGYWSTVTGEYLPDVIRVALGHDVDVPRVAAPDEVVASGVGGPGSSGPGAVTMPAPRSGSGPSRATPSSPSERPESSRPSPGGSA